jgi:hypothetical protein
MSYDPALVERIRVAIGGRAGVTEQRMFGGIGFMQDGNLLVSARGKGGMLVRVGPQAHATAIESPHTSAMEMGGRGMLGYVIVAAPGVASQGAVASWIERAWAHVRTLAPKTRRGGARRAAVAKKASARASARVAPKKKPADRRKKPR